MYVLAWFQSSRIDALSGSNSEAMAGMRSKDALANLSRCRKILRQAPVASSAARREAIGQLIEPSRVNQYCCLGTEKSGVWTKPCILWGRATPRTLWAAQGGNPYPLFPPLALTGGLGAKGVRMGMGVVVGGEGGAAVSGGP